LESTLKPASAFNKQRQGDLKNGKTTVERRELATGIRALGAQSV
jgi:hypothetical protein